MYFCIYIDVFRAILGYFSKPIETGKLPNVPSEILLKLDFSKIFYPSSLTCSQSGARTQVIVFMPVCMPVCATLIGLLRQATRALLRGENSHGRSTWESSWALASQGLPTGGPKPWRQLDLQAEVRGAMPPWEWCGCLKKASH